MTEIPKSNSRLKNLLQASALIAEGFSKKSAGNVASKIVESKLDLSDWRKKVKKNNKPQPHNQDVNDSTLNEWMPKKESGLGDYPIKKNKTDYTV